MARNAYVEQAMRELEAHGVKEVRQSQDGKHIKLTWAKGGISRVTSLPCTPSDYRGILNSRSDLRRQLAEVGAKRLSGKEIKKGGPRLVASTAIESINLLEARQAALEEEVYTQTDLLLEVLPEIKIAKLTDATFRIRAEVPAETIGRLLGLFVTDGVDLKTFRYSQVIGEKPAEASINTFAESLQKAFPDPQVEQIEEKSAEVAEQSAIELIMPEKLGKQRPQKHQLLFYLAEHGPKSTVELKEAGLTGYGGNPDMLVHFCSKQKLEGLLSNEGRKWSLTKQGELLVEYLRNNPTYRAPQKRK